MIKKIGDNLMIWLIASLTIGLAPFTPEPHIVGKIRWIMGGAVGMEPKDWFDFLFHGIPWMLLILGAIVKFVMKK